MEHVSGYYIAGLLVGILVPLAALFLVIRVFKKKLFCNEYDERQKLAQGKAYKWSYFTLLGYLLLGGLFDLATGIRWCDLYTFVFMGVFLSLAVFIVLCLQMDAYVSFRQRPKQAVLVLLVIAAMNLIPGIINISTPGVLIADGMLTYHVVNPLLGLLLLISALSVWFRYRREQRENGQR